MPFETLPAKSLRYLYKGFCSPFKFVANFSLNWTGGEKTYYFLAIKLIERCGAKGIFSYSKKKLFVTLCTYSNCKSVQGSSTISCGIYEAMRLYLHIQTIISI
jgi:hypothetical protein